MARQARRISKTGNYYVVLKGAELFINEEDKKRFLEIAEEKFEGGSVYGVCIYKTEIRMVVKEPQSGISAAMKSLTTVYARYFNREHGKSGKLFESRFRSEAAESEAETEEFLKRLSDREQEKTSAIKPLKKENSAPKKPRPKSEKGAQKENKGEDTPKKQNKNLPSWLL